MGDRDGSPSLPGSSATTGRTRRGRKVRSLPAGDEARLRSQFGPAGRGAGRAILSCAIRGSFGDRRRERGMVQEGPRKQRNPSSDWDPLVEATPELVSQDRGAGDLRVVKLTNTGRSFARRRWGLAAMPAPISLCTVVAMPAAISVGPRRRRGHVFCWSMRAERSGRSNAPLGLRMGWHQSIPHYRRQKAAARDAPPGNR